MYRGRHEYTLDEKGRVAIPNKFRELISSDSADTPSIMLTNFDKCLVAYPMNEWVELEEKIMSLPQFDPKTIGFQRFFVSGACECVLDKAGRILIPQSLRDFAQIERDVVFLGSINKFEIWSMERWNKEQENLSGSLIDFSATAAQHGIRI